MAAGLFPTIKRWRDARHEAQWLDYQARTQHVLNPALHARVVVAVNQALACKPVEVDVDTDLECTHESAFWSWQGEDDMTAQKTIFADGRITYEILTDRIRRGWQEGPWVDTATGDWGVRFMAGASFSTPEEFLGWCERELGVR